MMRSNPLREEVLGYIDQLGDDDLRVLRDYLAERTVDADIEMTPENRAALTAAIKLGRQQIANGEGIPGDEFMRRFRNRSR